MITSVSTQQPDAEIVLFPCLNDNYGYLIHDKASGQTAVVDTPDADEIIRQLQARDWQLTHILTTHHHWDHVEGLAGILDVVGRALEPVYGFRSLATFKSRFKPDYRTLYLYYQDPLQLPAMGRALSRAYLPGLSVRQSARLLRTLVR